MNMEMSVPRIDLAQGQTSDGATEQFDPALSLFQAVRAVSDESLHAHEFHVGRLAQTLATRMNLNSALCHQIGHAAGLHDIGKFAIPSRVLGKEGKLNAEELEEIKRHCEHGATILERSGRSRDSLEIQVALYHHERWDGSGYSSGLEGEDIPIAARITALADVYDALRAKRPYKPALTHEDVVDIIVNGDGRTHPGHFDPNVLATFKENHLEFEAVWREQV